MLFNNWNISGCVKLRMLDNKTSSFDVTGDIPDGWDWQLFYSCNGNLNIVDVEKTENGLSVLFTKEMLPIEGTYHFQLKGTKGELVKHTNIVKTYVNKSLSGDTQWPVVPSEFEQFEQAVKKYAAESKQSAMESAESARQSAESSNRSAISEANAQQSATESAESARRSAESSTNSQLSATESAESSRQSAESSVNARQSATESAESARQSAEYVNQAAEFSNQSVESANQSSEFAKQSAESANRSSEFSNQAAESANQSTESANRSTESAESSQKYAEDAKNAVVHPPIIGDNNNWFIWSFEESKYVDTGLPSQGENIEDISLGLTSASVGQFLRVAEVDTQGIPTKWKSETLDNAEGVSF